MNLDWLRKIKYSFQQRALVLMYHCIDTPSNDPWELSVSPENFEQQLQVLKKFRLVSASLLVKELRAKSIQSDTVALTFDDGYADNFLHARPLLEKYSSPATFFICPYFIGRNEMYWWDALAALILESPELPRILSIEINGQPYSFELDNDARLNIEQRLVQNSWAWHQQAPTRRCMLYLEIWKLLKPLDHAQIRKVINSLYYWSGSKVVVGGSCAMDRMQFAALKGHPLIDTGVHSVTHPALSQHSSSIQHSELAEGRRFLLDAGYQAELVAYPYGDHNEETLQVAAALGLHGGFTTAERVVTRTADPLRMGRFQVRNINGEQFEKQLRKWFREFPVS